MKNSKTTDLAILTGFFAIYPWLVFLFWTVNMHLDGVPVLDYYEYGIKPSLQPAIITTALILPLTFVAIYYNKVGDWFKFLAIGLSILLVTHHGLSAYTIFTQWSSELNFLGYNQIFFTLAWLYITIKFIKLKFNSNKAPQPTAERGG